MHHSTLKLSGPSSGTRVPGTPIMVTILTALLPLVCREAVPPCTHSYAPQMVPVLRPRPVAAKSHGNPCFGRRVTMG